MRIGIHTGSVVVGEIGAGERTERLALGETPNIAARVQGMAEPDTVVMSAVTQRLVHGLFEHQDLGPQTLKGIATPLSLFWYITQLEESWMTQAYSQLKRVLDTRRMTVPELQKRIARSGVRVNLKSLYCLSKEHQPIERLDMRVAGAICQVCQVPLSELIAFEAPKHRLQRFSGTKQKRLDILMDKNNDGQLTTAESEELHALVREAEELTLTNARLLAKQRRSFTAQ